MSKAEERALEAYPYNRAYTDNDIEYDGNFSNRLPYIEGYKQDEKDLSGQVKNVADITRKETIEQTVEWLTKHAIKYYINSKGFLGTDELVKDYKFIMSMKNE